MVVLARQVVLRRDLYSVTMLFQLLGRGIRGPKDTPVVISIASRCYSNAGCARHDDDRNIVVISIASRCYSNQNPSGEDRRHYVLS